MPDDPQIFATDDEIAMLRDSARRFLAQKWPVERAVALGMQPDALRQIWRDIAAQGWLALGGEGAATTATVLLEELGAAACPAPLLDTVLANTILRRSSASLPAISAMISSIEGGTAIAACALEAVSGGFAMRGSGGAGHLTGHAAFVDGMSIATHCLVLSDKQIALIEADAPGVQVIATPGFSVPPLSEIIFEEAPALVTACDCTREEFLALSRLGVAARAFGAARRGFDLIVDYAKVRVQFGKKIGQYQAIQHKLANCLINLDVARLSLLRAAEACDRSTTDWIYAANAAFAIASPALRQVCLETHHAFGGVSFWEEHEMPRHFRRIHGDLTRYGGVHAAREAVADFLLDGAA